MGTDAGSFEKLAVHLEPASPLVAGFLRGCKGLSEQEMLKSAQRAMALDPDIADEFLKTGWTWGGVGNAVLAPFEEAGGSVFPWLYQGGRWLNNKITGQAPTEETASAPQNPVEAGGWGGKLLNGAINMAAEPVSMALPGASLAGGWLKNKLLGGNTAKVANNEVTPVSTTPLLDQPSDAPSSPLPDPTPEETGDQTAPVPAEGNAVGMGPGLRKNQIGNMYDKQAWPCLLGCSPAQPYGFEKDAFGWLAPLLRTLVPRLAVWGRTLGGAALKAMPSLGGEVVGGLASKAVSGLEGGAAKSLASGVAPAVEGAVGKGLASKAAPVAEAALGGGPSATMRAQPSTPGKKWLDDQLAEMDKRYAPSSPITPEGGSWGQPGVPEVGAGNWSRSNPGVHSPDLPSAMAAPEGDAGKWRRSNPATHSPNATMHPPAEALPQEEVAYHPSMMSNGNSSATMQAPPEGLPGFSPGRGPALPPPSRSRFGQALRDAPGAIARGVGGATVGAAPFLGMQYLSESGARADQAQAQAQEAQAGVLAQAASGGDTAFGQFVNSSGMQPAVAKVLQQMWQHPGLKAQLTNQQQAAQILHALNIAAQRGVTGPNLFRYAINQLQPGAGMNFPMQKAGALDLTTLLGSLRGAKAQPWLERLLGHGNRLLGYGKGIGHAFADRYTGGDALERAMRGGAGPSGPFRNMYEGQDLKNQALGLPAAKNDAEQIFHGLDKAKGLFGLGPRIGGDVDASRGRFNLSPAAGDAALAGGAGLVGAGATGAAGGLGYEGIKGIEALLGGEDKQADFQMPASFGEGLSNAGRGIGEVWQSLSTPHKAMLGGGLAAMIGGGLRGATSGPDDHSGLAVGVGGLLSALYGASGGSMEQLGPNLQKMTGFGGESGAPAPMGGRANNPNLPPGNLAAAAPSGMARFMNEDGTPRIAEIVKAPDDELLAGLKTMTPQARQQLSASVTGFKPSWAQSMAARMAGIDIEGQRNRFLSLLQRS